MKRLFKSILKKANITFFRFYVEDEAWTATVHNGQLYLAKGTTIYLCGDCQTVINKCFTPEMKVRIS